MSLIVKKLIKDIPFYRDFIGENQTYGSPENVKERLINKINGYCGEK